MRLKKKTVKSLWGIAIFLALTGILTFYRSSAGYEFVNSTIDGLYSEFGLTPTQAEQLYPDGVLVHFIDVGQADSTLIQTTEQNILIDAGMPEGYGGANAVIPAYLRAQGVERLDLVIATHMHTDHIAGMKEVLLKFGTDKIIFPELPYELIPTDRGYEDLLEAISLGGNKITRAIPGERYELGGGAVLTLLAPLVPSKDMNENSVVCRLDYGDTSFMFMGDAGSSSEKHILKQNTPIGGIPLRADVLKLGHHGSATGSSAKWLDAVNPSVTIASMGADNPYGHPSSAVVKRLRTRDIPIYRTDKSGSIVVSSNGHELVLSPENEGESITIIPPGASSRMAA